MAAIVLRHPEFLLALPVVWLLLVFLAWRRRFRAFGAFLVRLAILVFIVLALAQPVIPTASDAQAVALQQKTVILVDQSASLTPGEQQTLRTEAERLTEQFPNSEILYFADQPVLADAASRASGNIAEMPLDPHLTDLAEAISVGAEMLAPDNGRLILLSDGIPTTGNVQESLEQLIRHSTPVDVLILDDAQRELTNDVKLVDLTVPSVLRVGETFDVELTFSAETATSVKLDLLQDTSPLAESVIPLEPGLNRFSYETQVGAEGMHTFQASIAPVETEDSQTINNIAAAFTQVYPPSRLLIVSDEQGPTARTAAQLEQTGFLVDTMTSSQLPERLSELEPYAGMVMLDISARSLQLEQMLAVQEFVRSLGRGLLVSGGRNSFSLGEYGETPLAEIIPLSLEPPPREERPPVALLLIIDHSGSMAEPREPATSLAMAKEAAIRATEILGPDDLIGILMFDNRYEWVVPFESAQDGAALLDIQSKIATIPPGGGTRILPALETGLVDLAAQETFEGPRHTVLFSDGKSFDGDKGIEDYDALVKFALESDITLSTIAIGDEADRELLIHLAELGLGRYHDARIPDELPALTVAESDILRSDAVQDGDFTPTIFAPHPVLRGMTLPGSPDCVEAPCTQQAGRLTLPNLTGYIAMTPKPRAEIALQIGPGDPLLAVWGYGLGRVAAWSSDTGTEWGRGWNDWPDASRFWGQVIDYTLPAPNLGLLQLSVELESDGVVTLIADSLTSTGQTVDLARTQGTLVTPAGREIPLTLRQVAPGRYIEKVRLSDPGAYQLTVTQSPQDEPEATVTTGFVVPYPAEYGLPQSEGSIGNTLLQEIANATGGQTFSLGQPLSTQLCDPQQEDCDTEDASPVIDPEQIVGRELWPWLILAALLLWPAEIVLRRFGRIRIQ